MTIRLTFGLALTLFFLAPEAAAQRDAPAAQATASKSSRVFTAAHIAEASARALRRHTGDRVQLRDALELMRKQEYRFVVEVFRETRRPTMSRREAIQSLVRTRTISRADTRLFEALGRAGSAASARATASEMLRSESDAVAAVGAAVAWIYDDMNSRRDGARSLGDIDWNQVAAAGIHGMETGRKIAGKFGAVVGGILAVIGDFFSQFFNFGGGDDDGGDDDGDGGDNDDGGDDGGGGEGDLDGLLDGLGGQVN